MKQLWIIATGYVIFGKVSLSQNVKLSLPEGLALGAGSAAYQVEGAWNASDKSESIWDRWIHTSPDSIVDGSNGDVACNFYHKYKDDVQLIKSIGLKYFRFSISWPRVLPTGFRNVISKDGLQYYKNLVSELVANGIEPVATLYHWDHPQFLEEMGGWTNELMVDWFVSYAKIMFKELGHHVKIWTTFNEANLFCEGAYGNGEPLLAPAKNLGGIGKYLCMHNILKAHAKTFHMYDEYFRQTQQGEIGIIAQCTAFQAGNASDTESVETAFQFSCGWVYGPIFHGDYPEIMKKRIAKVSEAQGYKKSRLPTFSEDWKYLIKGSVDYFGLNHYTSSLVYHDPDEALRKYNSDSGLLERPDPSWIKTRTPGIYVTPAGFGEILRKVKDEYDNPPVRVMENGFPGDGRLNDYDRIEFHYDYLTELIKAVEEDHCIVKSYFIWSLMDVFEWTSGYTSKFGMFSVDFNDPDRPRTARSSASWWKTVLETRELQPVPTKSDS